VKKLFVILWGLFCLTAFAAEVIPPAPAKYFNDYAHVVSAATAGQLNQRLEQFDRDTSSQIVVAIFPTMQSDSSIEDYTVRVAQSWKVGQKDKNNGAVLFVFTRDRKMFLQVGYGLEGALPDALCKRIISDEIAPQFKAGNYDAGLTAGVNAILAATKGEYKGNGLTADGSLIIVGDSSHQSNHTLGRLNAGNFSAILPIVFIVLFVFIFIMISLFVRSSGRYYGGSGWSSSSWSGGGFSSGGVGGGFSGGGGSFGGGGAGGSW
jgi:uncharacterized protein